MNDNINWEEVETKISIICYKFDNLASWREDLAQELRIHAYYVSDNYYDLYRKAIDFWRRIQTRYSPEVSYYDIEISPADTADSLLSSHGSVEREVIDTDAVKRTELLIRKELTGTPNNLWEKKRMDLALSLLDIILEDIDPTIDVTREYKSNLNHYVNQRLNLSWVWEETGESYKKLRDALKLLEDTVRGLAAMGKIEIPVEYFAGYYDT